MTIICLIVKSFTKRKDEDPECDRYIYLYPTGTPGLSAATYDMILTFKSLWVSEMLCQFLIGEWGRSISLPYLTREFAAVTNRVVALRFRQSHCALLRIAIPPIHKEISSPGEKRDAHIIISSCYNTCWKCSKKCKRHVPRSTKGFETPLRFQYPKEAMQSRKFDHNSSSSVAHVLAFMFLSVVSCVL